MLWAIGVLRALLEVAMLSLLAQGIMAILAGARREQNAIYRLFALLAKPPRYLWEKCFPDMVREPLRGGLIVCVLCVFWLGLAFFRETLDH